MMGLGSKYAKRTEVLLAAERTIPTLPPAVRRRAVERARSSLSQRTQWEVVVAAPKRRLSFFAAAACVGGLSLATLGALAAVRRPSAPHPTTLVSMGHAVPTVQAERPPTPPSRVAVDPALRERRAPVRLPRRRTVAVPTSVQAEHRALSEELALLDGARRALAQKDYSETLLRLDAHTLAFENGQLAQEREALRVQTWVAMGRREEALRLSRSFSVRFPHSVVRPVVEKLLSEQP